MIRTVWVRPNINTSGFAKCCVKTNHLCCRYTLQCIFLWQDNGVRAISHCTVVIANYRSKLMRFDANVAHWVPHNLSTATWNRNRTRVNVPYHKYLKFTVTWKRITYTGCTSIEGYSSNFFFVGELGLTVANGDLWENYFFGKSNSTLNTLTWHNGMIHLRYIRISKVFLEWLRIIKL